MNHPLWAKSKNSEATDTIITVSNPRLRDGKDIHYLEHNVVKVMWPVNKITLIEVLESEEEETSDRLCEGIIHA